MKTKKPKVAVPVRATMCMTCPFRKGSKHRELAGTIADAAMKSNRVCHSTGGGNAIKAVTGAKSHICRGARDFQIEVFVGLGYLKQATDAEWNKRRAELGLPVEIIKDP